MFLAFDPITNAKHSYVDLCVRTASPLNGRDNLIHAVLGLADEMLEIYHQDAANIDGFIKELGDAFWFTALYCAWEAKETDASADDIFARLLDGHVTKLCSCATIANRAISLAKREFAYKKEIDHEGRTDLFSIAVAKLKLLCANHNISIQDVLDRNIAKLAARYKVGTYSQAAAVNRDESKE